MEQPNQSAPSSSLEEPSSGAGGLDTEPGTGGSTPTAETNLSAPPEKPPKKLNPIKKFFKRFNLYFLMFVFICIVAGAITIVSYLNSKKAPPAPSVATQPLNQDALKQLANSDASVGGSGQTLTVQGNAIFSGQVLTKSDLGVAGSIVVNNLKAGTEITVPQLSVSTKANLNDTQIASLQVSNNTTLQGIVTLQRDLNVAGSSSFNGPVTIGQLSVTKLIMAGNATLQVPNHIAFTGASPARSINNGVLGAGGTSTINGSDTTGTININTGANPTAGCFTKLTFNQKFTSPPHVLISPVGSGAGQTQYYVDRDVNGFSVCTVNAAPANQVFAFDYFITQ